MPANIIAVLPEQVAGRGIVSRIYREDKSYIDDKTPSFYLDSLYRQRGKVKKQVDRSVSASHQIYRNIPYVIDKSQVFMPFKYRKTSYDKESRGFVNIRYVARIKDSSIILITGESLATLSSEKALIKNKAIASLLLYEQVIISMRESAANIKFLSYKLNDL